MAAATDDTSLAEAPDLRPGDQLARAAAAGDHASVARIVSQHAWTLFSQDHARLTAIVAALPVDVLAADPVLRLVHPATPTAARITRSFDPGQFEALGASDAAPIVVVMQMIAARMSGDVATALSHAERLGGMLRAHPTELVDDGSAWFLHQQIGSTLLVSGATVTALREFATARQIAEITGSLEAARFASGRAALAHAVRGSVREAERALTLPVMAHPLSAPYREPAIGTERVARALIALEDLSQESERLVAELVELDVADVVWPFVMFARARFELYRQQPLSALDVIALASTSHVVQPGSFAADAVVAVTVEAHLALGDLVSARSAFESAIDPGSLTRIAGARLAMHRSALPTARSLLESVDPSELGPGRRAEVILLECWGEVSAGRSLDPQRASVLAELATSGHRRVFVGIPQEVMDAVSAQLPPGADEGFVSAVADLPRASITAARPALTAGELRVLRALRENRSLAETAASLHVSINTVKTQARSLYRKLGVQDRTQAVHAADRLSL